MTQWYESTPHRRSSSPSSPSPAIPGSHYLNPSHPERPNRQSSLTRNETSVGGGTAITNESEPLLGEKLLLGAGANDVEDKDYLGDIKVPSEFRPLGASKPFHADASTIHKDDGDSYDGDPHIGINVITSDDMNTLSYSRDLDDSTFFTNDRYFRGSASRIPPSKILEEENGDDGSRRGCAATLFNRLTGGEDSQVCFLVCFGLAVGIGLCVAAAVAYVEYWHHYGVHVLADPAGNASGIDGAGDGRFTTDGTWQGIPFAKISRDSFGDPVSNIFDVSLFHPNLLYEESTKKARDAENTTQPFFKFPFPTGSFWTNLVMLPVNVKGEGRGTDNPNQFSYPIVAYPYSFQWSSGGKLQASYSAARRTILPTSIQDAFAPDLTFGSAEDIVTRRIVKFDSLSVSMRFYSNKHDSGGESDGNISGSNSGYWETYIVQGSPYITARYFGLTPELTALSDFEDISCPPVINQMKVKADGESDHTSNSTNGRSLSLKSSATGAVTSKMLGICEVWDESTPHVKSITGVQFIVTTKEQLTWLVFTSDPVTFEFRADAKHTLFSKDAFAGIIRAALVPPLSPSATAKKSHDPSISNALGMDYLSSSPGVKRLIYHAGAYPVGGTVSWDFRFGTRSPLVSVISSSTGHRRAAVADVKKESSPASKENNIGTITFEFNTMHMTSSKVSLLMLSLPHHAAFVSSAEEILFQPTEFDLAYLCIKGTMTPIVGNVWSYEEELSSIGFGDESLDKTVFSVSDERSTASESNQGQTTSDDNSALSQSIRDLIFSTLESDLKLNLPVIANGAYGFGKQVARLAQLAHIAERIENENIAASLKTNSSELASPVDGQARRIYALLQMYLTMWLTGDEGGGRLVYDASLGGILSKEGTVDTFADFGNARYNDHHFHYGYVLYASAILAKRSPQFISKYGTYIDAIFYDVAHNSDANIMNGRNDNSIFFPLARHKSWFDGHSFASGLFPFADGKSQESSSEAVNCYYGAYLWSKVRWSDSANGNKLIDFARLLLSTELTGAKTYWHMVPPVQNEADSASISNDGNKSWHPPVAYNALFEKNYMVGNLGMTDATCTTWFGTQIVYVHLINFMPVTPITAELFNKDYVEQERLVLDDNVAVDNSWRGYVICHKAILDPSGAWIEAQGLDSSQLDAGLSKSQVLHWVSTREGFFQSPYSNTSIPTSVVSHVSGLKSGNATAPKQMTASSISSETDVKIEDSSSCESHKKCSALNLRGQCCPTEGNVFLSCCN